MLCDNHVHSAVSFDAKNTVSELAEAAIARGLSAFAVTDHADLDGILRGIYPAYDTDRQYEDVLEARKTFGDRISIAFGIELGQPQACPEEARALLAKYPYDIVLGSYHNFENEDDFYFLPYDKMTEDERHRLFLRYLEEETRVAAFPGIHVLTHLTYPCRYALEKGTPIHIENYREPCEAIFQELIRRGIALEFNTKMLQRGQSSDPPLSVMQWYYEAGGRLISLGSDAHDTNAIGACLKESVDALSAIGFKEMLCAAPGGPVIRPLKDR